MSLKNPTKAEVKAALKNAERYSVPIMEDPRAYPQHVLDHPLREKAGILDSDGVPVQGKNGTLKHIVHQSDLYDSEGTPLPIYPLFADRMRAGNGNHGGPGFPALSQWYGKWGWANLGGHTGRSVLAEQLMKKLHREHSKHGFLGLVTVGGHDATAGNGAFIKHLKAHVLPRLDTSEKEGLFMDMVRSRNWGAVIPDTSKITSPEDFFDKFRNSPVGTTAKQAKLASLINGEDWKVTHHRDVGMSTKLFDESKRNTRTKNKDFVKELDMRGALSNFNDYSSVPAGHGVSLIRIMPHFKDFDGEFKKNLVLPGGRSLEQFLRSGGHPDDFYNERPGSPVYSAHFGGTYLGDLLRSVPLQGRLLHVASGKHSFTTSTGAHLVTGMPTAKKPTPGNVAASHMVMTAGYGLNVAHDAVEESVAKALAFNISPEHKYLDKLKSARYDEDEDHEMSRKQSPEEIEAFVKGFQAMSPQEQGRILCSAELHQAVDSGRFSNRETLEAENLHAIEAVSHPHVQAGIQQALRGVVQK